MTQVEMARQLGIKRTTYRNIESGPTKLINDAVFKIADILKRPAEAIISDYEIPSDLQAVLCEKEERYAGELDSLKKELSRCRQEISDTREMNKLLKEILDMERKDKRLR